MLSLFCYGCLVGDLLSLLGSDFDCSSVYLDSLYCFFGCCLLSVCLSVCCLYLRVFIVLASFDS